MEPWLWIVVAVVVLAVLVLLAVMLMGRSGPGRARKGPELEPPEDEDRPVLATKAVTPLRERPRKAVTTTRPKQPAPPTSDRTDDQRRPTQPAPPTDRSGEHRRPSQPVPPMKREVDRDAAVAPEGETVAERAEPAPPAVEETPTTPAPPAPVPVAPAVPAEPERREPPAPAEKAPAAEPEADEIIRPADAAPPPDAPTAEAHAATAPGQSVTAEDRPTATDLQKGDAVPVSRPAGEASTAPTATTADEAGAGTETRVDVEPVPVAGADAQPVPTLTPDEVSDQRERVRDGEPTGAPIAPEASRPLPDVDRTAAVEPPGAAPTGRAATTLPHTDDVVVPGRPPAAPVAPATPADAEVPAEPEVLAEPEPEPVAPVTVDDRDGTAEPEAALVTTPAAPVEVHEKPKVGERVGRMQKLFGEYIPGIRKRKVDEDTWDDLEEALLRCDVGVPYTTKLLDELRVKAKADGITEGQDLIEELAVLIKGKMADADRGLYLDPDTTNVWLVVGVNGVGKTTTIGKLGRSIQDEGHRVLFAAGDTFRAAAADQLQLWAERVGADIVRGAEGADPSSIIFDAIERANARGYQLVLADTAGRLHTKSNLMDELRKIRRVAGKAKGELTEVLLVLDATTGQNGLNQAKQFTDAVELTGVVLTKLDGTAKGGIALSIQDELGIPVKLIGLGEKEDDLIPFEPDDFVDALLGA